MGALISLPVLLIITIKDHRDKKRAARERAAREEAAAPPPAYSESVPPTHIPLQSSPRDAPPVRQGEQPPRFSALGEGRPAAGEFATAGAGAAAASTTQQNSSVVNTASTTNTAPEISTDTASAPATTTSPKNMASDEDYMAFLNKANEDPSTGVSKSASTPAKNAINVKSVDEGESLPAVLKEPVENEEWIYQSDADEAFVGVALKLGGKNGGDTLPNEETFAKLINYPNSHDSGITIQDVTEWDARGQYKAVVDAVRTAAKGGDVRVYRVEMKGARVEYWVVGVEKGHKGDSRLVGVKVLAVES